MSNETPTAQSGPSAAVEQLRNHQQQLDADGVMVGVSRQALDEVLASLTTPPAGARDAVTDYVAAKEALREWGETPRNVGRDLDDSERDELNRLSDAVDDAYEAMKALAGKADGGDAFRKLYEPDDYEDAFKARDLKEVMDLAEGIWRIHYAEEAPNFQPASTITGCVSQISNMVTGLDRNHRIPTRAEAKAPQPAATGAGEGGVSLTHDELQAIKDAAYRDGYERRHLEVLGALV